MSSRYGTERRSSIGTLSPLRHHSMNQESLGRALQGRERVGRPRKVVMAERKKARLAGEYADWCNERRNRIFDRVLDCLRRQAEFGYDGVNNEVLAAELRYLQRTDPLD